MKLNGARNSTPTSAKLQYRVRIITFRCRAVNMCLRASTVTTNLTRLSTLLTTNSRAILFSMSQSQKTLFTRSLTSKLQDESQRNQDRISSSFILRVQYRSLMLNLHLRNLAIGHSKEFRNENEICILMMPKAQPKLIKKFRFRGTKSLDTQKMET